MLRLICITKLSYNTSAWRPLLGFGCLVLILFIKQSPTPSKLQKMVSNKKSKRRTRKRRLSHKMLWWRVDYASTLLSLCISFLGSEEDLCAKPNNKMNHFFQVCCRKRISMFSTILVSNHGGATFDFNAGDVEAAVDNESSVLSVTCFMMSCEPI